MPSLVSLVWFCIFGGAAINLQQNGTDIAGAGGLGTSSSAPSRRTRSPPSRASLVMVLVGIFFVSGADAASIVMGSLSERGTIHPSRPTVIFWGVATGAVAAVMLLVGGEDALSGLQTITIIAALPFVLVMIGLAVALVKDLAHDPRVVRRKYAMEAVEAAVITGVTEHGDDFVFSVEKGETGTVKGGVEDETSSTTSSTTSSRWTTPDADVHRRGSRSPRMGRAAPAVRRPDA